MQITVTKTKTIYLTPKEIEDILIEHFNRTGEFNLESKVTIDFKIEADTEGFGEPEVYFDGVELTGQI